MYTVKLVSEMMGISTHTLRFYDKEGLFPNIERNENRVRLFSDEDLQWVYMVQCLRLTGMPLADIKHYIDLCKQGDSSVPERFEIIAAQKIKAAQEAAAMQERVQVLEKKMQYYKDLLSGAQPEDCWNPIYQKGAPLERAR